MSASTTVVDRFIAIWNESDPGRRRELVDQTFTEEATFTDPLMLAAGHANLDQMFAGAQAQVPGAQVSLLGEPEHHHGWTRFAWKMVMDESDDSLIEGTVIARIGADGRFEQLIGFLDKVPADLGA